MTKLEITIRKDDNGRWHTYTQAKGDELPNEAIERISIGLLNAQDYLNDSGL